MSSFCPRLNTCNQKHLQVSIWENNGSDISPLQYNPLSVSNSPLLLHHPFTDAPEPAYSAHCPRDLTCSNPVGNIVAVQNHPNLFAGTSQFDSR